MKSSDIAPLFSELCSEARPEMLQTILLDLDGTTYPSLLKAKAIVEKHLKEKSPSPSAKIVR